MVIKERKETVQSRKRKAQSYWFFFAFSALHLALCAIPISANDPLDPEVKDGMVIFSFESDEAKSVYVAGEFNSWLNNDSGKVTNPPREFVLQKGPENIFSCSVRVAKGVYKFKFVVDGSQWFPDGDDLKIDLLDDGQGGIKLKEVKARSNTKFSANILMGGLFYSNLSAVKDEVSGDFRFNNPANRLELDIRAAIRDDIKMFSRVSFDTSQNQYYLHLEKSHFYFLHYPFEILAFFNQRSYWFGNPNRPETDALPLRRENIVFSDSVIEEKKSGLNRQGLVASLRSGGLELYSVFAVRNNTPENIIGARLTQDLSRLKIGLTMITEKGDEAYPYQDQYKQFIDPESPFGIGVTTSSLTWYREPYLDSGYYSADISFKIWPFLSFFSEYYGFNSGMSAKYSNLGIYFWDSATKLNPDTGRTVYKSWDFYSGNGLLLGLNAKSGKFAAEAGLQSEKYNFSRVFGSMTPSLAEVFFKVNHDSVIKAGAEIRQKNWTRDEKNSFAAFIDPGIFDLGYGTNTARYMDRGILLKVFARYKSFYFVSDIKSAEYKSGGLNYKWSTMETVLGAELPFLSKYSAVIEGRHFAMTDIDTKTTDGFSYFAGLKYTAQKNINLVLGWGLYPYPGTSDDDEDTRLSYLKEKYVSMQSISEAEKALAKDGRVTLNAFMKF